MAHMEERIAMIQNAVFSAAEAESNAIITQTDEYRRRELEKVENKVLTELYGHIQNKVTHMHTDTTATVSQYEAHCRQQLLRRREELAKQLFADAAGRLKEYAQTPEYTRWLADTAAEMADKYPVHGAQVFFCPADRVHLPKLQQIFGSGCSVMPREDIRLGGLILENQTAGLVVDESLDSRLHDQYRWFYANSGMVLR